MSGGLPISGGGPMNRGSAMTGGRAQNGNRVWRELLRTLAPVVLALAAGGILLAMLGKNPLKFYGDVIEFGLLGTGWQKSMIAMAPMLLVGLGLIVAFRARLWNLGSDGQFLVAAALVAGFGPALVTGLPFPIGLLVLTLIAIAAGAAWAFVPALLKARFGTNEIISSLMMSFIGIGVANLLVKGVFQDPGVTVPQTAVMSVEGMLPYLPGTRVHIGFAVAIIAALVLQFVLSRTAFGLRLDVFGESPRAARHVGIRSGRMIVLVFVISGGLIGLAAAMDLLGLWGYLRTSWNPGYGDRILPFVFLARLSPLGVVPLVAFYAVLATGGTIAAQQAGLSLDFLLVIVALILVFMTLIELLGAQRNLGRSYLPRGLRVALGLGGGAR